MKIGIIGAGPRGLSVAERILYNNQGRHSLELILFDPEGPGAVSYTHLTLPTN